MNGGYAHFHGPDFIFLKGIPMAMMSQDVREVHQ